MQDFDTIQSLEKDISIALAEFERQAPDDEITQQSRDEVIELKQRLQECEDAIFRQCRKVARFRELLDKKLVFVAAGKDHEEFEWNSERKEVVKRNLLRKLCTSTISIQGLSAIRQIYFLNSIARDTETLRKLPLLLRRDVKKVAQYSVVGVMPSSKYMIFTSRPFNSVTITQDGSYALLDEAILHEFVHAARMNDPDFKAKSDRFFGLRFFALQDRFQLRQTELQRVFDSEVSRLRERKDLSDDQKTSELRKYMSPRLAENRTWLVEQHVPARFGYATENVEVISKEVKSPDVTFDHDFARNIYPKWFQDWGRDSYAMSDEDEYLAVALTLYRYDRKNAESTYSDDELTWLKRNWEYGYYTRPRK